MALQFHKDGTITGNTGAKLVSTKEFCLNIRVSVDVDGAISGNTSYGGELNELGFDLSDFGGLDEYSSASACDFGADSTFLTSTPGKRGAKTTGATTSVSHLITLLPPEVHLCIFDLLDPASSACLGVTCKKFYAIHRQRHGSVKLTVKNTRGKRLYEVLRWWAYSCDDGYLVYSRHINMFTSLPIYWEYHLESMAKKQFEKMTQESYDPDSPENLYLANEIEKIKENIADCQRLNNRRKERARQARHARPVRSASQEIPARPTRPFRPSRSSRQASQAKTATPVEEAAQAPIERS